ncbi:MAG TPA: hypothetical protein VG496_05560 [Myxococcales bacterium]|nr:hypothetical protein [Myxococcales bacterium]
MHTAALLPGLFLLPRPLLLTRLLLLLPWPLLLLTRLLLLSGLLLLPRSLLLLTRLRLLSGPLLRLTRLRLLSWSRLLLTRLRLSRTTRLTTHRALRVHVLALFAQLAFLAADAAAIQSLLVLIRHAASLNPKRGRLDCAPQGSAGRGDALSCLARPARAALVLRQAIA